MLRLSIVTLLTVFFGLALVPAQANTVERVFPQAEEVSRRSEKTQHYLLPLGRIREDRAIGRAQPSKFQRLQGDLEKYTWRLASDITLLEARQQVEDFLKQQHPERLFYCESRDCGESFAWANSFFQESVLFGSDRAQYLWVIKDRSQPRYHVLYLVERPNRRIYLHEDSLMVPAGMETAGQVALSLERSGRVRVGNVPLINGAADFSNVVGRIKDWQAEINLPVLLVLHRHGPAREQTGLVGQLRDTLKTAGIQGRAEDVGALAPDANATGPVWVEWVNEAWMPDGG